MCSGEGKENAIDGRSESSDKVTGDDSAQEIADDSESSREASEDLKGVYASNLHALHKLYGAAIEMRTRATAVLTSKLKEVLHLKCMVDDMSTPLELFQYQQRFAELYMQIQQKLQLTRRLYDTYNALLETKELASKEGTLLNSIHLQFQESDASGRSKLADSLEGVRESTLQKLEKLQLILLEEKNKCAGLKEKLAATTEDHHSFSCFLKSTQADYASHERSEPPLLIWSA